MRILVLDGYVDEPACLGVPPYVSPQVRYLYGAALALGHEPSYARIEEWRQRSLAIDHDVVALFGGTTVPGKYLRGYPMSPREAVQIAGQTNAPVLLSGPLASRLDHRSREAFRHICSMDGDAALRDALDGHAPTDRRRKPDERAEWSVLGASLLKDIPEGADRCIAEVELFRGCPRFVTGGCSFCSEPLFGQPEMRPVPEVLREVAALHAAGARNLRLGAQSCIFSYHAEGVGRAERPKPRPDILRELLEGIWQAAPNLRVLHADNANPAVMVAHPDETREMLRLLAKQSTDGNVLAMGLESADPEVARRNNLNTTAEETLEAVRMVNEAGRERGPGGLPKILPGLNFVMGLPGETARTYDMNLEFLTRVAGEGLLLRRINIRQVMDVGRGVEARVDDKRFRAFKERVRTEIDQPMLRNLAPKYQVIRRAMVEKVEGNTSFLRQLGSYPLLIAVPYKMEMFSFHDVAVTDWGFRSITAIEHPFPVNRAHITHLEAIPGIGRKRAIRIFKARPFEDAGALLDSLEDFKPDEGWAGLFDFSA